MKDPQYADPRYATAVEEQHSLRERLTFRPLPAGIRFVGGADVSSSLRGARAWAGIVVCDIERGLIPVAKSVVGRAIDFPYIPGLLGFREVPALLEALAAIDPLPDVILADAHGIAHPRGCGSASHFGVAAGVPAVGCAKSLLCGDYGTPGESRGSWSPLLLHGEEVGGVLRTRSGVAPVFVSPGHLSDIPTSIEMVLRCAPRFRIPVPIREAHCAVNEARRKDGDEVMR